MGAWPDCAALARDMGVPYGTVVAWKRRRNVPPAYWLDLIEAAKRRGIPGVTPESLILAASRAAPRKTLPNPANVNSPSKSA